MYLPQKTPGIFQEGLWMKTPEFEQCVICHKETNIPKDIHISSRTNYVEGVGQLCAKCACDLHKKTKYSFGF